MGPPLHFVTCLAVLFFPLIHVSYAQETIYSGPQVGESLPPFKVLAVNGPHAGREVDFISEFGDSPTLLIFAHYIDRNVSRILRPCDRYAAERASAGLETLYVYLSPDKISGDRRMAQVVKSLSLEVPAAVSLEGVEGPGSYGINKEAGVTVLIAKDRKVVSNITIIQPGLVDSPKIMTQVLTAHGDGTVNAAANFSKNTQATFEDLVWALLNTRQFVFNRRSHARDSQL